MSENIGNPETQIEQNLTHDLSPDHTLLLTNEQTAAIEQRTVDQIDINPDDLHAVMDYVSTTPRMTAEALYQATNPEQFRNPKNIERFKAQFPNMPQLNPEEAEAVFNHLTSIGLIDSEYTKKRGHLVEQLGQPEVVEPERASKFGRFISKLTPEKAISEVSKQAREYGQLNRHRYGVLTGTKGDQRAANEAVRVTAREESAIETADAIAANRARRQANVELLAGEESIHLRSIPGARLESQMPADTTPEIDNSIDQGDLFALLNELQPEAHQEAKIIWEQANDQVNELYEIRDPSDTRSKETFNAEELVAVRDQLLGDSAFAEKQLIRDSLRDLDRAESIRAQHAEAAKSPTEKYNDKLDKGVRFLDDETYGHLFDVEKLVRLHSRIQAEAGPLYNAELATMNTEVATQNAEIAAQNAQIEKRNRILPADQQLPLLPEITEFIEIDDIPASKRREIVDPIDARITSGYAGDGTPSEVLESLTLARLAAKGKLKAPEGPRKQS